MLPLGLRVLEAVQRVVDDEMQAIGSAKCALPSLQPASLWKESGRLATMRDAMFATDDGLLLAPTHEEEVTRLVAQHVTTAGRLPLLLHQIGPKFRKEQRPRGGLLRLREFVMKDMYSFDTDLSAAQLTYSSVSAAYTAVFRRLELPVVRAKASSGDMGGSVSHEYHLLAEAGEDAVFVCGDCGHGFNQEVLGRGECCECGSRSMAKHKGIELGHTFLLGTRYAAALGARFKDHVGQMTPMQMGCYGIGVSRLVAAIAEATGDALGLRWPRSVAPYQVILTGGQSHCTLEELGCVQERLSARHPELRGRIAIDDRADLSLSWRLKDAALVGVPMAIVLGRQYAEGLVEVYTRSEGAFSQAITSLESALQ